MDEDEPLTVDEALDALVVLQRRRAQLAMLEADLLVQVAGRGPRRRRITIDPADTEGTDSLADSARSSAPIASVPPAAGRTITLVDEAREEIAAALHRPPATVHEQIVHARLLFGPLTATRDAVVAGTITEAQARVICDQARRLLGDAAEDDPDALDDGAQAACDLLQERVLVRCPGLTTGRTRSLARRIVAAIDVDGERRRRRQARRCADVVVKQDDDGMAVLIATIPEADALRIGALVDAHARGAALDVSCEASIGERRAAALVDLLLGAPGRAAGTHRSPAGVEIQVTVSLAEILDPHGPVAELLSDPEVPVALRRLLTDPRSGAALDLGRSRYVVSDPLRRWIAARDVTCTFPGCARAAHRCDIDHVVPWQQGGRTDTENLQALCRRHHQLKTHGDWQVTAAAASERDWLSPRRRRYRQVPPARAVPEPLPPVGYLRDLLANRPSLPADCTVASTEKNADATSSFPF